DQDHYRAHHGLRCRTGYRGQCQRGGGAGARGFRVVLLRDTRSVQVRAPGTHRRQDHRLGRPGHGLGRELHQSARAAGRQARRRHGRFPRGGRCRFRAERLAGRPDRQDRRPRPLCRGRHLWRHPAPGRHEGQPGDRGDQQGRGGADFPGGRLRRGRRPVPAGAVAGRGTQKMSYQAPLKDMRFVLNELAGLGEVAKLPGYQDATPDTVGAILEQASKFASEVLDPINLSSDQEGSVWKNGAVTTPKGFKQAYQQYVAGGWGALPFGPEHGGHGLPKLVATAVEEMLTSSNMSFSLCPLLTQGAIHAIELVGSAALKKGYLAKMTEGVWTGTMNLTEPQAGSDLALVRTRAVRQGDHYRISGQKIFITYGEHDLTRQIVHLV